MCVECLFDGDGSLDIEFFVCPKLPVDVTLIVASGSRRPMSDEVEVSLSVNESELFSSTPCCMAWPSSAVSTIELLAMPPIVEAFNDEAGYDELGFEADFSVESSLFSK